MIWEAALVLLRNGGKVTRPNWESEHYWVISEDRFERILCHNGTNAKVHLKQLEGNDWEIWKEKEVLSMNKTREFEQDILNVLIKYGMATKGSIIKNATIKIEQGNTAYVEIGGVIC